MVTTSFDYVSQKQDGSMKGAEGNNPLAAQLLGAPVIGEKAGAMEQSLNKATEATAQLLDPKATIPDYQTPRNADSQKSAEAAAVTAGLSPGSKVLDTTKQVPSDTGFDPAQAMSIRQQADNNVFGNLENRNPT